MELRHIRYFLAVADEGHFTRAAGKLGIGQPPLSQQIRDLEEEIGTRLFHRLPHGAELTEAGAAFRAAVEGLPAEVAAAVRQAQRAGRGETGRLKLGFTATANFSPVMPGLVRAFRERYPKVELSLEEGNSAAMARALIDGQLDLAFLRQSQSDQPELRTLALPDERLIAALPARHAQTEAPSLRLADLCGDPFIITPRPIGPAFHDSVVKACRMAGFEPTIGQAAPQIASILSLVSAEFGVALVPQSLRQFQFPDVVFKTLSDVEAVTSLGLVFSRQNRSMGLRNFVGMAIQQIEKSVLVSSTEQGA